MEESVKIVKVIDLLSEFGGVDGEYHKQWLLDQIARIVIDNYADWVMQWNIGENGPYKWDIGIAPPKLLTRHREPLPNRLTRQ